MCITCGCSETGEVTVTDAKTGKQTLLQRLGALVHAGGGQAQGHHHDPAHGHGHGHGHDHPHDHDHDHDHDHGHSHSHAPAAAPTRKLTLEQDILAKNQMLAERNRGWLAGREVLALNLVSSPGSGKTTLLERTLRDLKGEIAIKVIEGDQAKTSRSSIRICFAPAG